MISEEILHKHNADTFREIEIQDHTEKNSFFYSKSPFSPKAGSVPEVPDLKIIPISQKDIKFNQVIHFARYVKWFALFEFLMTFTYILITVLFLLALLICPVLGFFAGKNLNKCLGVFYLVYLILSVLLRIILIATFKNLSFIVVGTFVIVTNLAAIRYVSKFLNLLKIVSEEEKNDLLILQNGIPDRKNDDQSGEMHADMYSPN